MSRGRTAVRAAENMGFVRGASRSARRAGVTSVARRTGITSTFHGGGFTRSARNSASGFIPSRARLFSQPPRGFRPPLAPPIAGTARNPVEAAIKAKGISRVVAGAAVGAGIVGGFKNRSGRPADKVSGRPTGMYGY